MDCQLIYRKNGKDCKIMDMRSKMENRGLYIQ